MPKFSLPIQPNIPTPEEAYKQTIEGSRMENSESIVFLPIKQLKHSQNHDFNIQEDKVNDLQESIQEKGILVPLIVRELSDSPGYYEIIAGHHRYEAAKNENIETVPCIIKNVTDDEAALIMIDTNIQRGFTDMKPSEISRALKKRHEILCRQGRRTDLEENVLTSGHGGRKLEQESKMSVRSIRRYIALNNLINPLMDFVDDKTISLLSGVELSYISKENQEKIANYLLIYKNKITFDQAENLKHLDKEGNFPKELPEFFDPPKSKKTQEKAKKNNVIKIKLDELKNYIPNDIYNPEENNSDDIKCFIFEALKFYIANKK